MTGDEIKELVWCNSNISPQVLILTEGKIFWHFTLVWFSFDERVQYYLSLAVI